MNSKLKTLVEASLSVALSIVLSYFTVFRMPQGGSVSLSMLPLLIFSLRRGGWHGMAAGAVTGLLHILLGGYIVHPVQALLDYPIASGALGLAGFFGDKKLLGIITSASMNLLSSILSGVIFFASYAPKGVNVWLYSLAYNSSVVIPEALICSVLVYIIWPRINKRGI